jgi:hypothetical protein
MMALKRDALAMKEAILRGDCRLYADILRQSWVAKKKLAASVSNPFLDSIYPRFPISDHFQWKPLVQKIDFNDLLWFFWHTSRVSFSSVDKYGIRTAF